MRNNEEIVIEKKRFLHFLKVQENLKKKFLFSLILSTMEFGCGMFFESSSWIAAEFMKFLMIYVCTRKTKVFQARIVVFFPHDDNSPLKTNDYLQTKEFVVFTFRENGKRKIC